MHNVPDLEVYGASNPTSAPAMTSRARLAINAQSRRSERALQAQ